MTTKNSKPTPESLEKDFPSGPHPNDVLSAIVAVMSDPDGSLSEDGKPSLLSLMNVMDVGEIPESTFEQAWNMYRDIQAQAKPSMRARVTIEGQAVDVTPASFQEIKPKKQGETLITRIWIHRDSGVKFFQERYARELGLKHSAYPFDF